MTVKTVSKRGTDMMNVMESVYTNTKKIEFLLETAIMNHLDTSSPELEMVISLIRDTNDSNLKMFADMGI